MSNYDEFEQARLDKIERMRQAGTDPYPVRFDRTHEAVALQAQYEQIEAGASTGEQASVAGRVMLKRGHGKLAFGVLRDASGEIQLMAALDALGDEGMALFEDLDLGDVVGARGEVIRSKRGELSIRLRELVLLAKAIRPLPEKWSGLKDLETRYRRRYLDLIVNPEARRVALERARIVAGLRAFLTERGFIEVETPMLQTQAGGAAARPFLTHMNALELDLYLRIAPELYLKRLLVGGLEKVFELNRNFRNEGMSPRHNPEFTMLEVYEAYADYHDMMTLTQELIQHAAGVDSVTFQEREIKLSGAWRRATLLDLVREAIGEDDLSYEMTTEHVRAVCDAHGVPYEDAWGVGKLITELFEKHVEGNLWDPTFVIDYPVEVSPLARLHRDDPHVTERFELIVAGREIANAFSELNDPTDQRSRFEAQVRAKAAGDAEAMGLDEDYLRALEYGMPPAGGLGVGVDRLVMLLTDQPTIREVILFPTMRPEA
jgi:lysyl-tRNA synthetase, class II